LIARALALEPKILILDEPTASLDSESKSHIYSILEELNRDMTIIMVTHDMSAIASHVQTLACLNKQLYYHGRSELSKEIIDQLYGCPIDLIAHGVPHRILKEHNTNGDDRLA
jgi:zinc transport system ATP-binding protein